jgi:8-oxo-dGTP diphosphatase
MDDDRPWIRIAAHGLCVDNGRILLARLSPGMRDVGRWTLPGGGLDWGEPPEDGVVREIYEETGLTATVTGVAGVYSATYPRSEARPLDSLHFVSIVYRCRAGSGELIHEREGTTDLAAWHPLDEADRLPLVGLVRYGLSLIR